jgi:hypothetical protein
VKFLKHEPGHDFRRELDQQGDVQLASAQSVQHFPGRHVVKLNAHAGIRFLESAQRPGEQFHRQRRRVADMDFAALSTGNGFYGLDRFVGSLHHGAGFREEDAPGFSKPHGSGAVVEQGNAKLLLDVADLAAQGRLRNVKTRRRPCHVLFFSDGDEISQVAEFHSRLQLTWQAW